MAVFQSFDWDKTVRGSKGNNILEFKKLNIFYGRNYSGKTTLSRMVRALNTNKLSDKYDNPEFEIEIEGDGSVSNKTLNSHTQTIRVFNKDFIRDNLRFLVDEDEDVHAFAILGDKNIKIESEIKKLEMKLGSEEAATGMLGDLKNKQVTYEKAKQAEEKTEKALESLLIRKANDEIKTNPDYKDVKYNIVKIKKDISAILNPNYKDIESTEIPDLKKLLNETPKKEITEKPERKLDFAEIQSNTRQYVEKKIVLSNPIKELIEDTLLESWVRTGISIHRGKRSVCGFCGNDLPSDLMGKLDNHFNKESESLRSSVETLITTIDNRIIEINDILSFDKDAFYEQEKDDISNLEKRYQEFVKEYKLELNNLKMQLNSRLGSISTPIIFKDCTDHSSSYTNILEEYNKIIKQTNQKTKQLDKSQNQAMQKLRLHEISTFLKTIEYIAKKKQIAELEKERKGAEEELKKKNIEVAEAKSRLDKLRTELKDEKKGAVQVNKYLGNYFGHAALSLAPINDRNGVEKFKFEIQRNGEKAYNMSEGECSLVSFCYFMAKLDDINTKGNTPIIWIDDPISSLDSNHIFFLYSLISGEIVKNHKFKQLFISTHNLDFLKYLKRLKVPKKETLSLLIQRCGTESVIVEMPEYMSLYVTEFNYLFHQIYKCANSDVSSAENAMLFYDFGNNARKYLELLLAFKFPNPKKNYDEKLECFLGESCVESLLVDRINNEYSHMAGVFERGIQPIDIPEMKKSAQFLLDKTYEHDKDQFNSLMECIGEPIIP